MRLADDEISCNFRARGAHGGARAEDSSDSALDRFSRTGMTRTIVGLALGYVGVSAADRLEARCWCVYLLEGPFDAVHSVMSSKVGSARARLRSCSWEVPS
jgi:hypothetical protein